jgi:hypothetical protein
VEASELYKGVSAVDSPLHDYAFPFGNLESQKLVCAVSFLYGPSLMELMTQPLFYGSLSDGVFQLEGGSHVAFASDGSFAGRRTSSTERCNDGSVGWMPRPLTPGKLLIKVS